MKTSRAGRRVLTQLEYGPQTVTKLAAATGLTPARVRRELVAFREADQVVQDADLVWHLVTEDGAR